MNAAHTPTPWRIAGKGTIRTDTGWVPGDGWIGTINWRNRDANAEFIVRAANSHEELVAALKPLAAFYERHFAGGEWQDHEFHWAHLDGLNVGDIRRAHAAFTKAKAQS